MKSICPWAKVLVMLRDPVERAYSQYQMCVDPLGTPEQLRVRGESAYTGKSFEQVATEEIAELQSMGITPSCTYADFQQWLSTRPMDHGGHSVVGRGLYALQLQRWVQEWPAEQLRVYGISSIKGEPQQVQQTLEGVFSYLGLPPHDVADVAAKNTRQYPPMSAEGRALLQAFYLPFNQKLFQMLDKELLW
ncbi:P-loop containing nucleoside triphosphate hydrolase protein [Ochromonadaceae sp. CCMP2298]|nr:P-loop containing nucleoside triphosphate hydrolase protein [Ochromonadaceae sp. CCMP2298]